MLSDDEQVKDMDKKAELEESYEQIVSLYDVADALIADIKNIPEGSQEAYFKVVNPLVEQLEAGADILTEEFIHLAENDSGVPCERSKKVVESTLRKTFAAIDVFFKTAAANKQKEMHKIFAGVMPLVQKAKRQLEQVIVAFMQLVDLSFTKIMPKSELEKLKEKEPKVAEMLNKAAQENSKGRQ